MSPYDRIGGMAACRRLAEAFYARVSRDAVLLRVYGPSLHCAVESLALYLAQFLGGPCEYSERRWSLSLREAHLRFHIGAAERDAWIACMRGALAETAIDSPELERFFDHASAYLVNQEPVSESSAQPSGDIGRRWKELRRVEEIVAHVRAHRAQQAIELAETGEAASVFSQDPAALPSLLGVMSSAGSPLLDDWIRRRVGAEPGLVRARYTYSRTLLHEAAGHGNLAVVSLLLAAGADPNAEDKFGHRPLYSAANEHGTAAVVRALVQAGADPDARDRVKQCAALHMAARRGNLEIAQALLACGANPHIRDRKGVSPLERAVNCRRREVAALLRAKT